MAWWLATLKPGNKAPYLHPCRDEYEADEKESRARDQGLEAKTYHTATDNIFLAKQVLRRKLSEDFGYMAGSSNFRSEE